jgi:cytochrome P450
VLKYLPNHEGEMFMTPEQFNRASLNQRVLKVFSTPLKQEAYTSYAKLSSLHPVCFNEEIGAWQVFRYQDVQTVLLDTQTFSSAVYNGGEEGSILMMDPPNHQKIRSLASHVFAPRMIAKLESRIREIVNAQLDLVIASGKMDVTDDLSFPLPITVIAELLGVPTSDQDKFRVWAAQLVGTDGAEMQASSQAIMLYFQEAIRQRRENQTGYSNEDFLTGLLAAEVDGEHLSESDIMSLSMLLLVAGHETTTNLINNALVCLDEHPEAIEQLRADSGLWSTAIEEILRYRGPIHSTLRLAKVDTAIGGQTIEAGQIVIPMFASANLDDAQFPNADSFDIQRSPNRHIGFGYGVHFCLGAPLARLEARIALTSMLDRLPRIRRDRSIELELKPSWNIYSLKHLPITFG